LFQSRGPLEFPRYFLDDLLAGDHSLPIIALARSL
jgi:hypothetical protein